MAVAKSIAAASPGGPAAQGATAASPGPAAEKIEKAVEEKETFTDYWQKYVSSFLGAYITLISEPATEAQFKTCFSIEVELEQIHITHKTQLAHRSHFGSSTMCLMPLLNYPTQRGSSPQHQSSCPGRSQGPRRRCLRSLWLLLLLSAWEPVASGGRREEGSDAQSVSITTSGTALFVSSAKQHCRRTLGEPPRPQSIV